MRTCKSLCSSRDKYFQRNTCSVPPFVMMRNYARLCGASFHGNSAGALRPLPPVPADRSTYTTAAGGPRAPSTVPRCCRTASNRATAYAETPSETCPHRFLLPGASVLMLAVSIWESVHYSSLRFSSGIRPTKYDLA